MNCPVCQTRMTVTEYLDSHEALALVWIKGWRCVHCGYAVNPLGEFNRRFLAFDVWPAEHIRL
jgi:C4-type Zn-finger protein